MAGLVLAIHDFPSLQYDVDARHKPGHDMCGETQWWHVVERSRKGRSQNRK
jgi:hypothetical protein